MTWKRPPARSKQWTGDNLPGPRAQPERMADTRARLVVSIPKTDYLRSPALLRACRDLPCQACGTSDGTVVAAHSNQAIHGKGRSIKASDQFVAAMCNRCHFAIDQSALLNQKQKVAMWEIAHEKTRAALQAAGMWPE